MICSVWRKIIIIKFLIEIDVIFVHHFYNNSKQKPTSAVKVQYNQSTRHIFHISLNHVPYQQDTSFQTLAKDNPKGKTIQLKGSNKTYITAHRVAFVSVQSSPSLTSDLTSVQSLVQNLKFNKQ